MSLLVARWRTFPLWSCGLSFRATPPGKRLFMVGVALRWDPTHKPEWAVALVATENFWIASAHWHRSMLGAIGCELDRVGRTSKGGWSVAFVAPEPHGAVRNACGTGFVAALMLAIPAGLTVLRLCGGSTFTGNPLVGPGGVWVQPASRWDT